MSRAAFLASMLVVLIPTTFPAAQETEPPSRKSVRLSGRVLGPDGGPVPGATVRIFPAAGNRGRQGREAPRRLTTLEDGSFLAKGLEGDSWRLRIQAEGFAPFNGSEIPSGASMTVRLKSGHPLPGIVLDLATGKPLPGATVRACDREALFFGEEACLSESTDETGRFEIENLPRGTADVVAVGEGHARGGIADVVIPLPIAEGKDGPDPIEMRLGPGGRLAGRVLTSAGKPLEGATVILVPGDRRMADLWRQGSIEEARTDEQGRFDFSGVPTGKGYRLRASRKGYSGTEEGPLAVETGSDRSDFVLTLGQGAAFTVRLVDPEEKPVAALEVEIRPSGRRTAGRRLRRGTFGTPVSSDQVSGRDGRFKVSNLRPGVFTVRLIPDGWADVERKEVRLREGETIDLGTVVVREGRSISGLVTDTSLEPIAGATVRGFWRTEGFFKSRQVRTDAEGRYRLPGLSDEPVNQLLVAAEGYARGERRNVLPGEEAVDFLLEPTGSVVGRVLLSTGEPPPAFQVEVHAEIDPDQEGAPGGFGMRFRRANSSETFIDPAGNFRLDNLEPGTYTVEAKAKGKASSKRTGLRVLADQVADAGTITLEEGLSLRGRVLAAADDTPVPGAAVQVTAPQVLGFRRGPSTAEETTMTGNDGLFVLEGLEPGAHMVYVEHPDFSRADTRVELEADVEPADLVVRLSQGGTLTGSVRDADGLPVPEARILVSQGFGGGDSRFANTGPDGRYLFERLAPGSYQVSRMPDENDVSFNMGMKRATIEEGETTVVDFDEQPRINLSGLVLRGDEPLGDALLFFVFRPGPGASSSEFKSSGSDAAGRYQVGLDQSGTYQVMVQYGRGSTRSSVELTVPDEPEAVMDIVLRTSGISGLVTDADGQPLAGAVVTVRSEDGGRDQAGARTDSRGFYLVEAVEPGTYTVSVTAPGHSLAQQSVAVTDESFLATADFRLESGRTLRGRVLDPQGRGLPGAMVFVTPSGAAETAFTRPTQTDINGAFTATAPAEGAVDLTALSGGWAPAVVRGVTPRDGGEGPEIVLQVSMGGRIEVLVTGPDARPVSGAQVAIRSLLGFPGANLSVAMRPPPPTDLNGLTVIGLLAPGPYEVILPGRRDVPAVQVQVEEGSRAQAVVHLPAES